MHWEGTGGGSGCEWEVDQAGLIFEKAGTKAPAKRIISHAILKSCHGGLRSKLKIFGKSKTRLPHATWARKVRVELATKSWHRIERPGQADITTPHSKVLESEGAMTNGGSLAAGGMVEVSRDRRGGQWCIAACAWEWRCCGGGDSLVANVK